MLSPEHQITGEQGNTGRYDEINQLVQGKLYQYYPSPKIHVIFNGKITYSEL